MAAKTVKIKLDMDIQEALKTSEVLKQKLNDIFSSGENFGVENLINTLKTLGEHVDKVTQDLNNTINMLNNASNAANSATNADAQNAQLAQQLQLLNTLNSRMQLLIDLQNQSANAGQKAGKSNSNMENLRDILNSLNEEYASLESRSQECADTLTGMGEEGSAALLAWTDALLNADPELRDFNELVDDVMRQFSEEGFTMSGDVENVLREWADVANRMAEVESAADELGVSLGQDNRLLQNLSDLLLNVAAHGFQALGQAAGAVLGTIGAGFKRVGSLVTSFGRAANQIRGMMSKIFGTIVNLGKKAVSIFSQLTSGIHKTSDATKRANGSFGQLFKTVLATVVGIKGLSAAISSIKNIGSEGLKSIGNSFSEIKDQLVAMEVAWLNFKASIVSIVQPIYSVVQPALAHLVSMITNMFNTVAKFVAAFTGQGFIYKGVANAAKVAGSSAKKATDDVKKLVKQLASFDELNNLSTHEDTPKSGGADSGMFKDVEWAKEAVPDWIKEIADKAKAILAKLFDPLKQAWNKVGKWVIDSWKFGLSEVWELIKSVGSSFLTAWGSDTVKKIFEDILFVIGAIGRGVGIVAEKLRSAWDENDRGIRFFESIFSLVESITEQMKLLAADTLNWLSTLDFGNTLEGLVTMLEDADTMVSTISETVRGFIVDVVYKYISYLIDTALPELFRIVDDFLNEVDWDALKENITKIFGPLEHALEEITDGALKFIDTMAGGLAEFINSPEFAEFTDSIAEFLSNISAEDVYNGLTFVKDVIVGFFTELKDFVTKVWNSKPVQSFLSWLKGDEGDGKDLGTNIAKLVEIFAGLTVLSTVAGALGSILSLIGSIFSAISTVVTFIANNPIVMIIVGIGTAIASVVEMFKNGWNVISTILEALGLALAVIGAILLGAPATVAAIVAGIVFAVTQLVIVIKEHWDEIVAWLASVWSTISEFFINVFNKVKSVISNILEFIRSMGTKIHDTVSEFMQKVKNKISEIGESVKHVWENIWNKASSLVTTFISSIVTKVNNAKTTIVNAFTNIKNGVVNVFSSMWNGIKGWINSILSGIESMVNGVINGINGMISALNNLQFTIPDWVPEYGGSRLGFNISKLGTVSLPRLAEGAVIPPNKEFMAILGDQKSGTNIETPLDTMIQAFNAAGGKTSEEELMLMREQNQLLRALLEKQWGPNDRQIFSSVQKSAKQFTRSTGLQAF